MVYCGQRGWRQSEGGIRGTLLGTVAEAGINKGKKKSDETTKSNNEIPSKESTASMHVSRAHIIRLAVCGVHLFSLLSFRSD